MTFIKGHEGYNKGLKLCGEYRNCLKCGKECWFNRARILNGWGKYCSRDCSNKANARKGKESWNYKKKVGYDAVHDWLKLNFGKANKCENKNCKGLSDVFHWAKLKGKSYLRKRENFWMLCRRCHLDYDDTIPYVSKGRKLSEETKRKISIGTKLGMKKVGYNVEL